MIQCNISNSLSTEENYQQGLLPQRNDARQFYQDSSCRSNLTNFSLSSENRRIIRKTEQFTYEILSPTYSLDIQKQIFSWLKILQWEFPISSVKTIFTRHLFNYLYVWQLDNRTVAYAVCLFTANISHIAYVFYDPEFNHSDLPIRLVLQVIIDSQQRGLKYCYLGRFSKTVGYYKRNMPNFEYYHNGRWSNYSHQKIKLLKID